MAPTVTPPDEQARNKTVKNLELDLPASAQSSCHQSPYACGTFPGFLHFEPNEESLQSILDADEIIKNGGRGYKSAQEMFGSMGP